MNPVTGLAGAPALPRRRGMCGREGADRIWDLFAEGPCSDVLRAEHAWIPRLTDRSPEASDSHRKRSCPGINETPDKFNAEITRLCPGLAAAPVPFPLGCLDRVSPGPGLHKTGLRLGSTGSWREFGIPVPPGPTNPARAGSASRARRTEALATEESSSALG